MVEIKNLTYQYQHDGHSDTYRYDMLIDAGEIVGVLGHSGSGKSTLLDLISGFLTPKSGEIVIDHKDMSLEPPEKRPITILFQDHNLFEHLTAIENVLIGLRGSAKGNEKETKQAEEMLSKMKISDQRDKVVSQLSGGQQQRVALARALIRNKPILLLDEPFSGLDDETKDEILDIVRSITTSNKLHTVMVTHDKRDCDKIADKVYEIKDGKMKLVQDPPPLRQRGDQKEEFFRECSKGD